MGLQAGGGPSAGSSLTAAVVRRLAVVGSVADVDRRGPRPIVVTASVSSASVGASCPGIGPAVAVGVGLVAVVGPAPQAAGHAAAMTAPPMPMID